MLRSIPSVTIDKTGTVSIRGGFAFEAAYEFEGIDYTTPSANLQNTLQNVANFNLLNGVGSVQLIPGGGDATHGDTGTGLVLFTAKHGTYPSYFHVDAEALVFPYLHQLGLEWGWADPSQRLSNYAGFIGIRRAFQYGIPGTAANTLGTLGTNAATLGSTIDPNLVYYSPQFLSVERLRRQPDLPLRAQQRPAVAVLHPGSGDHADARLRRLSVSAVHLGRHDAGQVRALSGDRLRTAPVNTAQQNYACDSLIPLFPGQPNTYAFVSQADQLKSPFLAYKLEYGVNLGTSSLLTARYFRTFTEQSQDMPAQGIFADPYGGTRTAGQIDVTTQIGSKNLLKYGTIYEFVVPYGNRYDFTSYTAFTTPAYIITYPITHPLQPLPLPYTYPGLLPNNNPCGAARARTGLLLAGVLRAAQLHLELRLLELVLSRRRALSVRRRRLDGRPAAVRRVSARHHRDVESLEEPSWACGSTATTSRFRRRPALRPRFPASSISGSTSRTSICRIRPIRATRFRIGFGHTLSMPLPSLLGADVSRAPYAPFATIPSYDNSTGKRRKYCGPLANQLCANYADQLYWLTRDYRFGSSTLEAPLVGATFTNIDLSWAHEFRDGSAMKITPFYRRGYNVVEQTAQIIGFNYQTGSPVFGDVAVLESRHSKSHRHRGALHQGVPLGVSMQVGATYISQFGNEPPGAFLQPAALALGIDVSLAGSLAVSNQRRVQLEERHGWRINPVHRVQRRAIPTAPATTRPSTATASR